MKTKQRNNGAVAADIPILDGQRSFWPQVTATMASPCIIGLDTSRAPARMVTTILNDRDGRIVPQVTDEVAFNSLTEFCDYWHGEDFSGIRIAVPAEEADPLRIRAWLQTQAQPLEEYHWMAYRAHLSNLELRDLDLDEAYARPYVLAIYACYRLNAASVARGLWAKLFEVHYLLEDVRHEVHRLAASLPEPEDWDLDVPF